MGRSDGLLRKWLLRLFGMCVGYDAEVEKN